MTMYCATLVSFTQVSAWSIIKSDFSMLTRFLKGLGPLALAPMFGDYIEAFDSNLTDVVQFTGIAILVLGFSNFIWVPLMTCFGRRPTVIVSSLLCFASAIWRARANTYGSFMGACVLVSQALHKFPFLTYDRLNGIASGPAETAQPAVIADVMFLHERGTYNTLYFASYFGSLMVSCQYLHRVGLKKAKLYRLGLSYQGLWPKNTDGEISGGFIPPFAPSQSSAASSSFPKLSITAQMDTKMRGNSVLLVPKRRLLLSQQVS